MTMARRGWPPEAAERDMGVPVLLTTAIRWTAHRTAARSFRVKHFGAYGAAGLHPPFRSLLLTRAYAGTIADR
jgi:hypothetical protein